MNHDDVILGVYISWQNGKPLAVGSREIFLKYDRLRIHCFLVLFQFKRVATLVKVG